MLHNDEQAMTSKAINRVSSEIENIDHAVPDDSKRMMMSNTLIGNTFTSLVSHRPSMQPMWDSCQRCIGPCDTAHSSISR